MQINKFLSYLLSPYTLSVSITIIIIFFLPEIFSKYKIGEVKQGKTKFQNELITYNDFDNDGNSDKILSFLARQDFHCIQVFDHEGGIVDQWNLDGTLPGAFDRLIAADYNNDGLKEIFVFSQSNDSLFLYAFKPLEQENFFIRHRFITCLSNVRGDPEYSILELTLRDMNKDSFGDLIFVVNSGFTLQPRQVFIFDIHNDSLLTSASAGSIISKLKFTDINEDGFPEIIGNSGASGNISDSLHLPYSDYSAWLKVFDHNLNLLFEPIEFQGMHSFIKVQPITYNSSPCILSFFNHCGSFENYPTLKVYDKNGRTFIERKLWNSSKIHTNLINIESKYWLLNSRGNLMKIGTDLHLTDSLDLNTEINNEPLVLDLDNDQKEEIVIFKSNLPEGFIFRSGFKDPVIFNVPQKETRNSIQSHSIIYSEFSNPKLFIQRGENYKEYEYGYNGLYMLKFPVYLGIFISVLLFILLIRKIQRIQIRDKLFLQNQISELQLKTINNQLDPHFTLNAFNAIASLLKKEKGEIAYSFFIKFSSLVRSNLISADKISRSIEDEINIAKNYLDIQKLRFNGRFDYKILIGDGVDINWRIPKMTIQNYIENAVKHGLKDLNTGGLLYVKISKKNSHILIEISDNGIGRKEAMKKSSTSTGMGVEIMQHYFKLLNKYNAVKIRQEFVDLYDQKGNGCGTKVIVEVPVNINYNISNHV